MAECLYVSQAGLRDSNKPIGAFLFTGPTGCGKTEVVKQLSEAYNIPMLRYDMSEYMERHSLSKLIGAPPGYVGYDDSNIGGGKLMNDVEQNQRCVILFDEMEKRIMILQISFCKSWIMVSQLEPMERMWISEVSSLS